MAGGAAGAVATVATYKAPAFNVHKGGVARWGGGNWRPSTHLCTLTWQVGQPERRQPLPRTPWIFFALVLPAVRRSAHAQPTCWPMH